MRRSPGGDEDQGAPLGALAYLVFGKDRHGHDITELTDRVAARR
jgi:hypothetical protein